MRISHEAIYQSLYIEGRGALKRELVAALRTGRALRKPRARAQRGSKPHGHVTKEVMISQRPAQAADRAVPGHWEGDLIIGTGRSAIGTVVDAALVASCWCTYLETPSGAKLLPPRTDPPWVDTEQKR